VSRTIVVNQATPVASLTSSANPLLVQNPVTLSVAVSASVSTPTGTVSFMDGTNAIGSASLVNGIASFTTATLSVGSHPIAAVYSGDANFISLTSPVVTESVQDFNLNGSSSSGASTSQTVAPGGTATYALTLSPSGSATFPAAVALTVSGLPAGASYTLTPTTIAAGAGVTNVTLAIQVPAHAASEERQHKLPRQRLMPMVLAILLLPFSLRLRRSARRLNGFLSTVLLLLIGAGATVGLIGCGSNGGTPSSQPPAQAPQSYSVSVTGTSGVLVHTTNLTLTVE
jgi:hypothetical protein